ncbi:MAG: glycosyltransferase family 2 protein [Candidatus Pacebacteria bacterium]|nr:glycosyltransferase family 2 protein [Candidatus Paceibacterota bacterium]PIR60406.1 MAG: hypothetical protein COU68_02635 [Candidatus Pacebacteria bacterium CG10_big_fil_rev_8_21_14_0_10_45_6]
MQPSVSVITIGRENTKQPIQDFAAARNAALKNATSDWVVFLDSDEKISESDFEKLKKYISQTKAAGLYLTRSDIFYGVQLHYGEWGSTKILRAMQPAKAKYQGKVHEVPQISGTTEQTDVVILHTAHPSINQFIAKVSNYAALAAAERKTSLLRTGIEICTYPIAKFLLNYFLLRGFLDGWRGLAYATVMSLHSFFVRAYRISWHLQNETT